MIGFMSTNIMQNTQWKQKDIYLSEKYERMNNFFLSPNTQQFRKRIVFNDGDIKTEKNYSELRNNFIY